MSPVRCPYCQFELELKGMKPGRFQPSCPGCKKKFVLKVPLARGQNPKTRRLSAIHPPAERTVRPDRPRLSRQLSIPELRGRIGGCQIVQKLGHGENGAVYLARQLSLDRHVALKVLSPELGSNPQYVSWLMRQAYAAAQLSHDNLVQIYDIGVQRSSRGDLPFFATEFVEGQTLADMIEESQKPDAEEVVGYVLQAARGLKFAHDHGMIHGNIKPGNLLLDDSGLVKVADLGLLGRSDTANTLYAAPELVEESAAIDERSDIYSLGCTLYELLTGQAPIPGRTPTEAIARAQHVPAGFLFIAMKMMSARPMDRYPSMSDVIAVMENSLAVGPAKPLAPTPAQVHALEQAVERFNDNNWNILRSICIFAFLFLALISIVVLALPRVGYPLIATGVAGFVIAAVVVYQILMGVSRRSFLLLKLREIASAGSPWDWLITLSVIAIAIGLLTAFDLQWIALVSTIAAMVVVATFFSTIDALLTKDRKAALLHTQHICKKMRLRGYDENAVRQFICTHTGRYWEEFYEALFGFEAKLLARQAWGHGKGNTFRPNYGKWREPIIAWLDERIRRREQQSRRRMFTMLEAKALKAKDSDSKSLSEKSRSNARIVVDKAQVIYQTATLRRAEAALPPHARAALHFNAQVRMIATDWMHDDSRAADEHDTDRYRGNDLRRRLSEPLEIIFGPGIRLVLSLLILGGFVMWRTTNNAGARDNQSKALIDFATNHSTTRPRLPRATEPLRIPYVPDWICDDVGSWNGGLVGILLITSTIFSGNTLGFLMLLSAATGLLWHRIDAPILGNENWTAALAALGIWIMGLSLARRSDGL